MAYAEAGAKVPPGDLYAIEGFDRRVVKIAVNIMFNAESHRSAVLAIAKALHDDAALRAASGVGTSNVWWTYRTFTETLVEAVEHKHRQIEDFFNSDCGARFQRLDSDMAMKVMTRMIQRTGRCPLPIHDSFLVADIDAEPLKYTMTQLAGEHGLILDLKESRAIHHNPGPHLRSVITRGASTQTPSATPPTPPTRCLQQSDPVRPPLASIQLEVTTPDLQGLEGSKGR